MSASVIISIISALIVASILVSGISYSRQQAMAKRQKQISKYRQQADEVISHTSLLLKVDPEFTLITQLQSLIVSALQSAHNLSLQDQTIIDNLHIQKLRLQEFKDEQRENEVQDFLATESELSQSQLQLSQITKLIDIYRNRGELSIEKSQTFSTHLKKLRLDLTVNSHLHQAQCCGDKNDISMAQMHIKQAREVIKSASLEQDEKNKRIKNLTDLLNIVKKTNKVAIEEIKKTEEKPNNEEGKKINY